MKGEPSGSFEHKARAPQCPNADPGMGSTSNGKTHELRLSAPVQMQRFGSHRLRYFDT